MAEKNTADIGFEKQIWNAACVLRGNMDASEYKGVVLGLIFLKYISDRLKISTISWLQTVMALRKIVTSTHRRESSLCLLVRVGAMFLQRHMTRKSVR